MTDNGLEIYDAGEAVDVMATLPELKLWSVWPFGL